MTTTTLAGATRYEQSRAAAKHANTVACLEQIGDLSRVVERDIEILKMNLAKYHDGHEGNGAWQNAWARLESAWETVRSELADGESTTSLAEPAPPVSRTLTAMPKVEQPSTTSPTARLVDRIPELTRWIHSSALAGAAHLRRARSWLVTSTRTQAKAWRSARARLASTSEIVQHDISRELDVAWGNAQVRLESARETVKTQLVHSTSTAAAEASPDTSAAAAKPQVEQLSANWLAGPFVLKPLPWVLGALGPVISSRTMQVHHGCHHAKCIELANQLSRNHAELAGKTPLEIVRWAQGRGRDPELLAAASEAWNHAFFWQCLTPWKKRPVGALRHTLDRMFGDFTNFAHEFASAGATHVGSGWLWLVANRRKQVRILTTSDADCPEARGYTCLLGIDLWEHAYYFDHQNRRREYLEAVIDRRLDWEFAEDRYRLALERGADARSGIPPGQGAGARNRSRRRKRQRRSTASRTPA